MAGRSYPHNGTVLYTYDDPTEITRKANWIKEQGLAGAMVWPFDGDTANSELMTAIANGLN
ncbi:glycosyl hydrolase family 18 protein [Kitasatospora sp. NPDC088783]|uniref:glycosyl hydrolase family 18 protein n=1 Tax=Kitasatospora sp. NPDC088783 TaxID=3364077 RepID=UPI00381582DF